MIGKQIIDYRISSLVSKEVMGTTYLGIHIPSNRQVSICLLNPYLINYSSLHERLQKKSALLADLQHANISKFYAYAEQAGQLYLISEYIQGASLSQFISSKVLSEERIWDIFMQLIQAFEYAYSKGITHFSIHPDNIIITEDDQVKVLNFAISSLFTDLVGGHLQPEIILGKVQYMSPEQIGGKPLDVRSDIYSLGVILFELITRQALYPSVLSESDIKNKIIKDSLPPTRLYTQAFAHSYTMQAIIDKATAKNPSFRFQTYEEFKESLLEEEDERKSTSVAQLIDEINNKDNKGKLISANSAKSTIKLVRQKFHKKHAGKVFIVMAVLASAMFVGFNRYKLSSHKATIALYIDKYTKKLASTDDANNSFSMVDKELEHESNKREIAVKSTTPDPANAGNNGIVQAGISIDTEADTHMFSKKHLQSRLNNFYEAIQSKNINHIKGYYAPTVTRFFNEYNVSQARLQQMLQQAWQVTPQDKYEVLWDTFQYYRDEKGNYVMDFFVNYQYRYASTDNWQTQKVYTIIKVDKNLKISYISSDKQVIYAHANLP